MKKINEVFKITKKESYVHGKIKPAQDIVGNIDNLEKLVDIGTELVDTEVPSSMVETDDLLNQVMAVLDDMFIIIGNMKDSMRRQ